MSEIGRDIRIGIRGLRRSPGFALAAILSLALAIGLNTVIFSILNAVLLQSIPVPDPGRLLRIGRTVRGEGFQVVSNPEYRDIAAVASFEGVLAHQINSALLNIAEEPAEVPMELVSGNYFEVLGLGLARGRGFAADEDRTAGTHPVLVISWRLWRQRFAADPEVVGREVRVNGHRFAVVGVAPEGFVGTFPGFLADIWVPLMMQAQALPRAGSLENRSDRFLNLIGRLAPGVTRQQATAELDAVALRMAVDHPVEPDDSGLSTASAQGVHPMIASVAGPFLGLLMAVVGLVLLIAAANVTNMILARASNRRHETVVRVALGAGPARLFREHLIEALLLTVPGAAGGVLVAVWGRDLVALVRPPAGLPVGLGLDVPIDLRVLGFSLVVALLLGVGLGLVPAAAAWRAPSMTPSGGYGTVGRRRRGGLRNALVVSQVAVSSLLLVGTGLLLQTLRNSSSLDAGFAAGDVVVVSADPSILGYDAERTKALWEEIRTRAVSLPQVEGATLGLFVPLGSRADQVAVAPAATTDPEQGWSVFNYNIVAPGYFELLGIPLLHGRGFEDRDDRTRPDVGVVNQTLAERMWPGEQAVGKRLRVRDGSDEDRSIEITGVAADIKYRRLGEPPTPFLYLPHAQWDRGDLVLHVRARDAAADLIPALASRLRSVDPELPLAIGTLREEMEYSLTVPRIVGLVLGISGTIGLFLPAMGVFAVVSYATARRIPEIGVRIALGAGAGDVRRLVVTQGLRPTLWGLGLGIGAATLAARALGGLLYGVHPADLTTIATVSAALLGVSILASYWPARQATAVDPAIALRSE